MLFIHLFLLLWNSEIFVDSTLPLYKYSESIRVNFLANLFGHFE